MSGRRFTPGGRAVALRKHKAQIPRPIRPSKWPLSRADRILNPLHHQYVLPAPSPPPSAHPLHRSPYSPHPSPQQQGSRHQLPRQHHLPDHRPEGYRTSPRRNNEKRSRQILHVPERATHCMFARRAWVQGRMRIPARHLRRPPRRECYSVDVVPCLSPVQQLWKCANWVPKVE